jgi:hypothetical protein
MRLIKNTLVGLELLCLASTAVASDEVSQKKPQTDLSELVETTCYNNSSKKWKIINFSLEKMADINFERYSYIIFRQLKHNYAEGLEQADINRKKFKEYLCLLTDIMTEKPFMTLDFLQTGNEIFGEYRAIENKISPKNFVEFLVNQHSFDLEAAKLIDSIRSWSDYSPKFMEALARDYDYPLEKIRKHYEDEQNEFYQSIKPNAAALGVPPENFIETRKKLMNEYTNLRKKRYRDIVAQEIAPVINDYSSEILYVINETIARNNLSEEDSNSITSFLRYIIQGDIRTLDEE